MPGFYVHSVERDVPEGATCDRCGRGLRRKGALLVACTVSYDGKEPRHRICLDCKHEAEIAYGSKPAPEAPGARKRSRGRS